MLPMKSNAVPINPSATALRSGSPYAFGTNPFQKSGFSGGFDPGMQSNYSGYMTRPSPGLKGMGSCGCGPVGGCQCGPPGFTGFRGLGQNASLDQVIANATSWLGGLAQSQLPASAAVPPGYGTVGGLATNLMNWAPYLVIGYLAYRLIK
jgi:hypothetical protein